MSETEPIKNQPTPDTPLNEKLHLQNANAVMWTLFAVLLGALIYLGAKMISMPYVAVGFFTLGLVPALAVVAAVGAIRGPITGFLTGYIGELLVNIILNGEIVAFTLYGVAFGVLGLVAGLPSYDFTRGRSLAKLSILCAIGMIFAALLTTVIGLYVERVAFLVAIGFQLLKLLTLGLPSVILLTPLFARVWLIISTRVIKSTQSTNRI